MIHSSQDEITMTMMTTSTEMPNDPLISLTTQEQTVRNVSYLTINVDVPRPTPFSLAVRFKEQPDSTDEVIVWVKQFTSEVSKIIKRNVKSAQSAMVKVTKDRVTEVRPTEEDMSAVLVNILTGIARLKVGDEELVVQPRLDSSRLEIEGILAASLDDPISIRITVTCSLLA